MLKVICARSVTGNPFRQYDGPELPVNTCIAVPAMAIQQDPDKVKNPTEFDWFRFARLNASKDANNPKQNWIAFTNSMTNLA